MKGLIEVVGWTTLNACPLCNSSDKIVHFIVSVLPNRPTTKWSMCENCGHVFCNPMPSEEWLNDFYTMGYRKMTHGVDTEASDKVPKNSGEEEAGRGLRIINFIEQWIGEDKTIDAHLDIGSSTGALLAGVMGKFKTKVSVGVEPNSAWREFSTQSHSRLKDKLKNMPPSSNNYSSVFNNQMSVFPSLKDVPNDMKFDLVTIIHTLEHVVDINEMFERITNYHLNQDGLLVICVPDLFSGVKPDPLMFPHLHSFRNETIDFLLESHGLIRLANGGSQTGPPFWYAPLDILLLAQSKKSGYDILKRSNVFKRYANQRGLAEKYAEITTRQSKNMRYIEG